MDYKAEDDVSYQKPFVGGLIDKVGIEGLEIPVTVVQNGKNLTLPALITAMVSLDSEQVRGIHMSRIYLALHNFLGKKPLHLQNIKKLSYLLMEGQKGLSKKAYLRLNWKWPVKRKALKTDHLKGWRYYPVFYSAEWKEDKCKLRMGMKITYSSTCPCSASLARKLIQNKFEEDFSGVVKSKKQIANWLGKEESIVATPHAQKSSALIKLSVKEEKQSFLSIIDEVEKVLGTPVQTPVKKADEQEFAKLNGKNLMFSEDAARKIKALLSTKSWVKDFSVYVRHFESLHPFEVACYITK